MALTIRSNGSGATNLVNSSWWNDYYNLLTGSMPDQPVSLTSNLTMKASLSTAATGTQTVALTTGGSMGVGVYQYCYTWAMADGGESLPAPSVSVTTDSTHKSLTYNVLNAGPTGTTKRNIYRTKVGASVFYYLASVNDNATTTYTDSAADTALTLAITAPAHSTFGGAIFFKDASGATHLTITPDGSLLGSGGGTAFGNTTITGTLNVSGRTYFDGGLSSSDGGGGVILGTGKIGRVNAGDIIDAGGASTYIKSIGSTGAILLQNNSDAGPFQLAAIDINGVSISSGAGMYNTSGGVVLSSNGVNVVDASGYDSYLRARGGINAIHIGTSTHDTMVIDGNGNVTIQGTTLQVNGGFFGVKKSDGTKLVEFKSTGAMNLAGSYAYGQGTSGFDSFDVAEVFVSDVDYPFGTVVCPADITSPFPTDILTYNPQVTKCTHDTCSLAMVISKAPGSVAGKINSSAFENFDTTQPFSLPVALVGRIYVKTAYSIPSQSYVTSDGRGGVRAILTGEKAFAIGVTIAPSNNGLVPIILRNMFVSL